MNKFRVGPDGRTAYEKISEHKCRSMIIGFGESVDYILETDKGARHKADSRVHQGIFLGYVWRSTECLVGNREGIFKWLTPAATDPTRAHVDCSIRVLLF